jgi:hypothetical protein
MMNDPLTRHHRIVADQAQQEALADLHQLRHDPVYAWRFILILRLLHFLSPQQRPL